MSNWIFMVVILVQSFANAERYLYISKDQVLADEAASFCNLATPDIHYMTSGNNVSLDGANLKITVDKSVWSGYVQTYAAFLYEGCCEEKFANSSTIYTEMFMDPGECYSKCQTDVIGMQKTTCHCNPKPNKANQYAPRCLTQCSNPRGTVCGGNEAVSIYRKVQYRGSGGNATTDKENCRAFVYKVDGKHFYTWRKCLNNYPYICDSDLTASAESEYYWPGSTWKTTAALCLQKKEEPAVEFFSRYPDFNYSTDIHFWIGQIRSHVISKDADSNNQLPGWRPCVITKAGGEYRLKCYTNPSTLKALCENVSNSDRSSISTSVPSRDLSTSAQSLESLSVPSSGPTSALYSALTSDPHLGSTSAAYSVSSSASASRSTSARSLDSTTQIKHLQSTTTYPKEGRNDSEQSSKTDDDPSFPMIFVYTAVPVVLVLVAVVVLVVLCKRRKGSKEPSPRPDVHPNVSVTETADTSHSSRDPEVTAVTARNDEYAVVTKKTKPKQPVTIDDNEYDTTVTFSSLKHAETNTYNRLDVVTGNTDGHNGEGGGNEVDIYDHAVSNDNLLKASKGRNTIQNDTTVTFSSLKLTETDHTYNRLNDVTGNTDTHETDGDDVDLYDHAVSKDRPMKAAKGKHTFPDGLYDTAVAVTRQDEHQTRAKDASQDIYAQPIPRNQRK